MVSPDVLPVPVLTAVIGVVARPLDIKIITEEVLGLGEDMAASPVACWLFDIGARVSKWAR
jgi:hypothetical protein